jgi:hypothetical protein
MTIPRIILSLAIACLLVLACATQAIAFCGFYVGGADAKLFNQASQVIIARNGDRTILTMENDFQGDAKNFAMVIPVPVAIKKEQVNVGKRTTIEKLDAFSKPRLVEYFDPDPCAPVFQGEADRVAGSMPNPAPAAPRKARARNDLGVTVEDQFKVNEYEIVILSARDSDGLETWLRRNRYNIPTGASALLRPYIKQKMKFFVAKVDLKEFEQSGYQFLRPIQIAYQSPKFVLPIRLGMINSQGEQDLVAYILSPKGQVELTNYRTVKIPTGNEIPEFVKNEFGEFYRATFQKIYERENKKVAFLEYAWDVSSCDPCSTEPPNQQELKDAGVFWLADGNTRSGNLLPPARRLPPAYQGTFITRLHVRYTRNKFPEDLMFQETGNRENFQGRYVMNHPFTGNLSCEAGKKYRRTLRPRLEKEAGTLASLTGWSLRDIYRKIDFSIADPKPSNLSSQDSDPFWRNVWGGDKKE